MPELFNKYISSLYLTRRFYLVMGFCIVLFITSFLVPGIFLIAKILLWVLLSLIVVDYFFFICIG